MNTTAFGAWVKSLPLALITPTILWPIYFWSNTRQIPQPGDALKILYFSAITAGIHFLAYLLTGLPIFLNQFLKPRSKIWLLPISLLLGTVIATLVFVVFGFARLSYIGAAYGFITAIAAWRQRPRHHENTHHLP